MMQRLTPNTLIIGAQKASSTFLMEHLNNVPGAFVQPKELRYFSNGYDKTSWDRYNELMAKGYEADIVPQVVAERCPEYMSHKSAVWNIQRELPDVKIIACLREPGNRAHSRFQEIVNDNPERYKDRTFARVLRAQIENDDHLAQFGHYAEQLAPYFALFAREQIHVVIDERLKANADYELGLITEFLGLPSDAIMPDLFHPDFEDYPMDDVARGLADKHFAPHNDRLRVLLDDPLDEWKYQPVEVKKVS